MKAGILLFLFSLPVSAQVPGWVPESKRKDFEEYISACDKLEEHSISYKAILDAKAIVTSCHVDGSKVVIVAARGEIDIVITEEIPGVEACTVKDGKAEIQLKAAKKSDIMPYIFATAVTVFTVSIFVLIAL